MKVVLYETAAPLGPSQRFMAFLADDSGLLPVRFCAATAQGARDGALGFWQTETSRQVAKDAAQANNIKAAQAARRVKA